MHDDADGKFGLSPIVTRNADGDLTGRSAISPQRIWKMRMQDVLQYDISTGATLEANTHWAHQNWPSTAVRGCSRTNRDKARLAALGVGLLVQEPHVTQRRYIVPTANRREELRSCEARMERLTRKAAAPRCDQCTASSRARRGAAAPTAAHTQQQRRSAGSATAKD